MTLQAFALVLFSTVIHATWNYFLKLGGARFSFLFWTMAFALLALTPMAIVLALTTPLSGTGFALALWSGSLNGLYYIFLSQALSRGDLTLVYPLARTAPAILPLWAYLFIGERISGLGALAIGGVVAGALVISLDSPRRPSARRSRTRGVAVVFALLTALMTSAYMVVDKVGITHLHPLLYFYVGYLVIGVCVRLAQGRGIGENRSLSEEWRAHRWPLLLTGLLIFAAYALVLISLYQAKVSYVVALRQMSIVVATLMGRGLLAERISLARWAGVAIIAAACAALAFA